MAWISSFVGIKWFSDWWQICLIGCKILTIWFSNLLFGFLLCVDSFVWNFYGFGPISLLEHQALTIITSNYSKKINKKLNFSIIHSVTSAIQVCHVWSFRLKTCGCCKKGALKFMRCKGSQSVTVALMKLKTMLTCLKILLCCVPLLCYDLADVNFYSQLTAFFDWILYSWEEVA